MEVFRISDTGNAFKEREFNKDHALNGAGPPDRLEDGKQEQNSKTDLYP